MCRLAAKFNDNQHVDVKTGMKPFSSFYMKSMPEKAKSLYKKHRESQFG